MFYFLLIWLLGVFLFGILNSITYGNSLFRMPSVLLLIIFWPLVILGTLLLITLSIFSKQSDSKDDPR
jgi:hypothetical protein